MRSESDRGDLLGGSLSDEDGGVRRETLRQAVFREDRGECVGCGARVRLGGLFSCHAHHVLRQQELRRRGISTRRVDLAILLCFSCHGNHENASRRVPYERLPERVVSAVRALGPWAEDQLRRYHPPTEGVVDGK